MNKNKAITLLENFSPTTDTNPIIIDGEMFIWLLQTYVKAPLDVYARVKDSLQAARITTIEQMAQEDKG